MTIAEYVLLFKSGVDAWNKWRHENPDIIPDLTKADLRGAPLDGADLHRANLSEADLTHAFLHDANPCKADLTRAN